MIIASKSNRLEELTNRNNRIQQNATNKFLRTINRAIMHSGEYEIISSPYENDEYLTIIPKFKEEKIDNDFIHAIYKGLTSIHY